MVPVRATIAGLKTLANPITNGGVGSGIIVQAKDI
jgi:hypothetical protein